MRNIIVYLIEVQVVTLLRDNGQITPCQQPQKAHVQDMHALYGIQEKGKERERKAGAVEGNPNFRTY